jgi:dihydrolipoamide dehydrogenase
MKSEYDVLVIGSGPGGYVAAIRAAQLGLKTAVVERETLGGVCLNWGCIPSKALLKNAEILSYILRSNEFGFYFDGFHADYSVAIDRSREVVKRNVRGIAYLLKKNNIDYIEGFGILKGQGVVEISPDSRRVSAKHIIIATGSRPRSIPVLPIDGQRVITSRESIILSDLPSSIVIVGGGSIGVEFAYLYRTYGVKTTIVELLPRLVPNEDEEISQVLERSLSRLGITVMTQATVSGFDIRAKSINVNLEIDGEIRNLSCEKVLVAIGVQPNTEDLGLNELGIATANGYIQIDENMETNVAGVYAVGDVTGKLALAHVASAQGVSVVERIAGQDSQPLDYVTMPRATYCQPQIASFGLTESQANEQGYDVKIGRFNVQANGKALAMGRTEGMVKLVVDAQNSALLGGHMIGPDVTELLGELSMAAQLEGTTKELGWMVHAHPTLSEMLKEAALNVQGQAIHM